MADLRLAIADRRLRTLLGPKSLEFIIDIAQGFCDDEGQLLQRSDILKQTSHELDKVFFRIHRGVRFPLRVRLSLVRNANARRASRSPDAFATGSRP